MSPDTSIAPVAVTEVTKRYGTMLALDAVSLTVQQAEIFGLLGPNGAGKSTLLESIAGLRAVDAGSVRVFGIDPTRDRATITARRSVQPQAASLFDTLSVTETLRLYASFHTAPADVDALIDQLGLHEQSRTRAGDLSGGQLRRLLIGTALVSRPELVVLDEPSAGLDPQAKRALHELIQDIREGGITVLLSTHDMQEATALCDRVGVLAGGRLRAVGAPDDLMSERAGEATVSFVTDQPLDLRTLREQLGENDVDIRSAATGARVMVRTADPDALVRTLTFDRTLGARDFTVTRRTLEDAYLELTADDGLLSATHPDPKAV